MRTRILRADDSWGVDVLTALDAAAVRRWSREVNATLSVHRAQLDLLNVFPVHDSDTGTNLVTTMRAAHDALADDPAPDGPSALQALARGAVLGASGNSGNIAAQLLRAFADAATEAGRCDAAALRDGLRRGAVQARAAVADPVDGTILTVAAAAADALPNGPVSLVEIAGLALAAADDALGRTPGQLPVLARAGVVDAGGQGLVLILEALVRTVGGEAPEITPVPTVEPSHSAEHTIAHAEHGHLRSAAANIFEVQYLLDADAGLDPDKLRTELLRLGDSVVVVGTGDGTWRVHVHTADAGAAVEVGLGVGRPHRISVSRLDDSRHPAAQPALVLALAPVAGLGAMFTAEGVSVLSPDGAPTVDDVTAAVLTAGANEVVLLTGSAADADTADAAAERIRRHRGTRVAVVRTRSPVQALAAVAVHDASRNFDDDVVAMAEAAGATRFAEVTVAEHESLTSAGICQAGDVLGLIDGEVVEIGHGVLSVALALSDRLLGVGAELITVLVGAEAKAGVGAVVRQHVRERSPLTEVSVYETGQARYPLIIGVE